MGNIVRTAAESASEGSKMPDTEKPIRGFWNLLRQKIPPSAQQLRKHSQTTMLPYMRPPKYCSNTGRYDRWGKPENGNGKSRECTRPISSWSAERREDMFGRIEDQRSDLDA
ncbi:hypothetical protein E6O75_ATG03539 [Venturia nashicola]|uniref:Uncharacterized protein n=1 Tax=Venturia nashicola TaxID=86259 RepID=A0A4Z1PJ80_9PEZI|nr:hypothetical protein E6O75_ATG03539 [Venturia nashicola]